VTTPAFGVAVFVQPGLDENALLLEATDDLLGGLDGGEAVQPAVVVVKTPGLVDRIEHG